MHSPKKQSIILCIKLTTQRCITDRMSTQEAYLDCSKHCATFPLEHTIHTAVVAQVLLLVLVVKISVTELSSVPPPPPPCFLQDSWTVSHDQRNHPPSHCSLRLPVKFLWVILCGKNCCNECNVVARQIMRLCWCSVSSGDIFWVVEHCFASLCSHKCFDAYAFRFSNQGKELEVWSCFCWYKNVLNL